MSCKLRGQIWDLLPSDEQTNDTEHPAVLGESSGFYRDLVFVCACFETRAFYGWLCSISLPSTGIRSVLPYPAI